MQQKDFLTPGKSAVFLLVAFPIFSTAMVAARFIISGQLLHVFLLWNLFLAWLPLFLALLAYSFRRSVFMVAVFGIMWLIFLPNGPYLITDLIHLRPIAPVPLWYDAIMLFSFALSGLLLGLRSLSLMQTIVRQHLGHVISWLFVFAAVGLSSFGVYIGRFLRWNSWDLFTNPIRLSVDVFQNLADPFSFLKASVIVMLFSVVMIGAYVLMNGQTQVTVAITSRQSLDFSGDDG